MTREHALLWTMTAAAVSLLIGWLALQVDADQIVNRYQNNKANHHPRSGDDSSN